MEGAFEVSSQKLSEQPWAPKAVHTFLALVIYFGLGAISGVTFTVLFPNRIIETARLHGISLVIVPLIVAFAMVAVGKLRRRQGKRLVRLDTFAYAFIFAFAMALVRFLFVS